MSQAQPKLEHREPVGRMYVGRLAVFLPLVLFIALAIGLAWGLTRNASEIPSTLIGQPVPEFDLPALHGREFGLSNEDLRGAVSLVNVWASWCPPCRREKPLFLELKAADIVAIHGINYKDRPADAAQFLDIHGDAYTRTGADISGRVGIEWGVYGIPETFVVDRQGIIRYRHVGEVTAQALNETILPLVRKLQEE